MGHQVYEVFVVTFIFELVTSIIVDPIKSVLYFKTNWYRKVLKPARFQVIKNSLELVYSQALVWFVSANELYSSLWLMTPRFGSFFCPLLPGLACFKILVLFYVKKFSTQRFCLPPDRAFRATHNYRFLINSISLVTLMLVAIPIGYTVAKFVHCCAHFM